MTGAPPGGTNRSVWPPSPRPSCSTACIGPLRAGSARAEAFVERLVAAIPVYPFDPVTARIHASLWASLAAKGAAVGSRDLWIAATAIGLGFRVATRDRRSFGRIPGLEVVSL